MQKKSAVISVLSLFLFIGGVSGSQVMAQPPVNPQVIRESAQESNRQFINPDEESYPVAPNAEQAQDQVEQARERVNQTQERAEQQIEQAQERIQARANVAATHAARLERRFEFYYQRLTKIAEKIEARLQILVDQGVDVTSAQEGLTNAMLLLEEAMERSNQAVADLRSIDPNQYQAQRQTALQARDEAQQARQLYLQAMEQMRLAVQNAMTEARQ